MATADHSGDAPSCATETPTTIPPDHIQAIRDRIKALRTEVLNLPHEILIPPERHDNRQRYAMFFVLDYALAAVDGDETPRSTLAKMITDTNERLPPEIARDNAADAELLAL